ncbi:nodulation efficiency protein D (NfeD) [Fusobacterium pseudoperiodonticum]|uniref:Nodulation efficiency protein D (NfeD) n=1 Tax=Fusobacterium pseudoperiodonticum TaxID=2663009 RepID=A0A2G9ELS8_9FUSO|nr:nodulation efficiency protein D (NfeD) [Fusobacterium pseudoperiodonticum]PIM81069.1 nodulation efficiency protein D (NfeD) [Fusobacterium pseudoperiodonticum]
MGYIFWLILTIIFTIIEFAIPSLVTVWFAFAAALTVFVSLISDNMKVEITFFTVVSLLSLIFLRPYARAILSKNKDNFDAEKIDTAIIVKKIVDTSKEEKVYDVSYKGSIWTALSNEFFEVGDTPVISSFKGNKIILKK